MEQQNKIKTTLQKISLIENIPVQFSINERRIIEFKFPTVYDLMADLEFKKFMSIISLTPEKVKELKLNLPFDTTEHGKLIQGLIGFTEYSQLLLKYFKKFVKDSEIIENALVVNSEKIMSYELQYIVEVMQMSLGQKVFIEDDVAENKNVDPNSPIGQILEKQKATEEKLRKVKAKKAANGKGYSIEEIMLAISYEFGLTLQELLNKTYFAVIWYFGYVSKVDAHKLNQQILSSGMSKQKSYNYWLNK